MKNNVKYSITGEAKTQCPECSAWKPAQYEFCWNCWGKKPQNTVKPTNTEGYGSWKDGTESSDPNF